MPKLEQITEKSKIATVVVTYNRVELLRECIAHLIGQIRSTDILIVDNASTDETEQVCLEAVASHSNIYYKRLPSNTGGAGGFNAGMRWAVEEGYEYVWIMDDDTMPLPNALTELVKAHNRISEEMNYGFLAGAVLWTDGKECKMNRQRIKKSCYEHVDYLNDGIIQIIQSTFVSLFIPSENIRRFGLPIKEFFIWGDDVEFTRRIAVRENVPCFLCGKSQVIHKMKNNNGSSIAYDAPERIDRYKYTFRNEAYLRRKEGFKGICWYLASCGLHMCRVIGHSKGKKLKRLGVIIGSMFRGLFFRPKIEKME